MIILKEQLASSELFLAGLRIMQVEIDMEGIIIIGDQEITTADMVDVMGREVVDNVALMLLVDPDEAREELRSLVTLAVRSFCEATPKYAVQCALENGHTFINEQTKFKDRVKLGLNPSTIVENIDCRKH